VTLELVHADTTRAIVRTMVQKRRILIGCLRGR
jgi:hypothetical protein